jgi:hypothetical protein
LEAHLVSYEPGPKATGRAATFSVSFNNARAFPVWYVVAGTPNTWFPSDYVFTPDSNFSHPLFSKLCSAHDGAAIVITLVSAGTDGNPGFDAVCVPPHSFVKFNRFKLETPYEKGPMRFSVIAAANLDVDDVFTLERWLPYKTQSSPNVVIERAMGAANEISLNNEAARAGRRVDIPKFIRAEPILWRARLDINDSGITIIPEEIEGNQEGGIQREAKPGRG